MQTSATESLTIQSYALVLVVDRQSLAIKAAGENAVDFCGISYHRLLELTLHDIFSESIINELCQFINESFPSVVALKHLKDWPEGRYQAVVTTVGDELILEIEPRRTWPHTGDYAARLNDYTHELEDNATSEDLLQQLCDGITHHFGYERAIVLKFDDNFNGLVTHESLVADLPSLLNVHFVEADVPATTRYNQTVEAVLNYVAADRSMVPLSGHCSDETAKFIRRHIAARGPNANTVRFLQDSGLSTLGVLSLIVDGRLWGSVYMHSREPLYIDYQMRAFLRVAGRVAQQKIAYHVYHRSLRMRDSVNKVRDRLYDRIVNAESLAQGLTGSQTNLLDLLEGTCGAAICSDDEMTTFGTCPTQDEVNGIVGWMKENVGDDKLWYTDHLTASYADAKAFVERGAGMLYLPLDPAADQWIVWFKPEVEQTIVYGSRSRDKLVAGEALFAINQQTCRECSMPWNDDTVGTAQALQVFIQKTVLERYASTRRHNTLLKEAIEDLEIFSYTVGHDLRAPLRGIASYAEILREDFSGRLGEEGLDHLNAIQRNAERMRTFMDDLLALSRIERRRMLVNQLEVKPIVERVLNDLSNNHDGHLTCRIQPELPEIVGDRNHMVIVFTNLLSNAFKYSAQQEDPRVEVGFTGQYRRGAPVFYVSDNGIGIPPEQRERMFELFTRSTNSEGFTGTGIGLALVHRIIRFHEGEVWIDDTVDEGTRILFYTGVTVQQ